MAHEEADEKVGEEMVKVTVGVEEWVANKKLVTSAIEMAQVAFRKERSDNQPASELLESGIPGYVGLDEQRIILIAKVARELERCRKILSSLEEKVAKL